MPMSTAHWGSVFLNFSAVQLIISIASEAQVLYCCWCVNVFAGVACERALLLGSREKSREYRTRKKTCVRGMEKASFPPPLKASPLARHSKWRTRSQAIAMLFSTKSLVSEGSSTLGSPNLSIAMFLFFHFAGQKSSEIITTCHT